MKKILFLTHKMSYGGAPKRLLLISGILISDGFDVSIAATEKGIINESKVGVNYFKIKDPRRSKIKLTFNYFQSLKEILTIVKENNIDIIACNNRFYYLICKVVSLLLDIKYYTLVQVVYDKKFPLMKWLVGDKILAVSDAVNNYLVNEIGVNKIKISTIKNTVPPKDKLSSQENLKFREEMGLGGYTVVSCIARYEKSKGHKYLLEGFKKLIMNYGTNYKLVLMGFGSLKDEIESYVLSNNLSNNIQMLSHDSSVTKLINVSDILVLPSLREGLSTFLLEVISIGKPIIASNIPGNDEIIDHNENGILVEVKNSHEICTAIYKLSESDNLAQKFKINSRKKYNDEFSIDVYSNKIINFFT